MKLTKCCMYPWSFMQIHAGGMMQPCAVGPDTDMGDFLIDYIEAKKQGKENDFLNNEGLQKLREGMMTGNLRPMCQNCFFVSNKLVTVEEFQKQLKSYLSSRLGDVVDVDMADLRKVYAYNWMAISFTNRCNLSCVYCVQSTMKDKNPYFKAEISYEYADDILDMMAGKGISRISTCVEGEATIYKKWQEVFSRFHEKYPHIEMFMTTNLNREYSEKDIELLSEYTVLDVSMDSLKPELYSKMRRNGRLDLLLKNLDKIDEQRRRSGKIGSNIMLHMVVSDMTWREIEEVADFAFSRGYNIQLGNYEERINTVAYQEGMLKPVDEMPEEDQISARNMIQRVTSKAKEKGLVCYAQGDIFSKINKNVEHNYNRFDVTGGNPIYERFFEQYPKGTVGKHFSVFYDRDNISYAGIALKRGECLRFDGMKTGMRLIYREVYKYKEGKISQKYNYYIEPGYRKQMKLDTQVFEYTPVFKSDDIEEVLLDISECWM